jgi:hypothetical protein
VGFFILASPLVLLYSLIGSRNSVFRGQGEGILREAEFKDTRNGFVQHRDVYLQGVLVNELEFARPGDV